MSRPRRASVALGLCVGTIISWLSQIFCAVTSRISRYTTYINRSNSCRIYENVEELPKLIGMVPLDRVRTSFNVLDFFFSADSLPEEAVFLCSKSRNFPILYWSK
jgi:hypothetical protein